MGIGFDFWLFVREGIPPNRGHGLKDLLPVTCYPLPVSPLHLEFGIIVRNTIIRKFSA